MTVNGVPPCGIYIDKEGKWFHEGAEMIHREIIQLFYNNMKLNDKGQYTIEWNGQRCYVEVEDTPFIVRRAELIDGNQAEESRIRIYLSDDQTEDLRPDTLYIGSENVLYCRIKERSFPARFSRSAYYQLAEFIGEDDGRFFLILNGEKYYVRIT